MTESLGNSEGCVLKLILIPEGSDFNVFVNIRQISIVIRWEVASDYSSESLLVIWANCVL